MATKQANAAGSRKMVLARERDVQALNLRKAGMSYERIADTLELSNRGAAWKCVDRALKATVQEAADDLRSIELERLDELFKAAYQKAIGGYMPAIDRCLMIMDRRSRYLGLDAPVKVQTSSITEEDILKAIEELNAQANAMETAAAEARAAIGAVMDDDDVVDGEVVD